MGAFCCRSYVRRPAGLRGMTAWMPASRRPSGSLWTDGAVRLVCAAGPIKYVVRVLVRVVGRAGRTYSYSYRLLVALVGIQVSLEPGAGSRPGAWSLESGGLEPGVRPGEDESSLAGG
eukprot:scaffold135279_cov45-Prasinocladus_malaysianus.AAC.3